MKKILHPAIFFGSGPVAAQSLRLLLDWHPIAAVITKRPPNHHKEVAPVEQIAQNAALPLFYSDTKTELDETISKIISTDIQYGIVIDYGVIININTIKAFPLGIINSHFSLLPEWRGADPITYALLSGQPHTGVSIMLIDEGLDTGNLLTSKRFEIPKNATNPSLTNALVSLSNELLISALPAYQEGDLVPHPQPNSIPTYSQKLSKEFGIIKHYHTATEVERQIRAFIEWPNTRLFYANTWLTITEGQVFDTPVPNGKLVIQNGQLLLGCKDSTLEIIQIQPAGKNKMSANAFINGYAHKLSITTI